MISWFSSNLDLIILYCFGFSAFKRALQNILSTLFICFLWEWDSRWPRLLETRSLNHISSWENFTQVFEALPLLQWCFSWFSYMYVISSFSKTPYHLSDPLILLLVMSAVPFCVMLDSQWQVACLISWSNQFMLCTEETLKIYLIEKISKHCLRNQLWNNHYSYFPHFLIAKGKSLEQ